MRDPKAFPEPDQFKADRFFDPKTNTFTGTNKSFVPFGIGKRECLGKSLAKMEQFIFTSALLHQFKWEQIESFLQ